MTAILLLRNNNNFLTQSNTGYRVEMWSFLFSIFCTNAKLLNWKVIQYIGRTWTILQVFSEWEVIQNSLNKEWPRVPSHSALGKPLSIYVGVSSLISSLHSLILQAFTPPKKKKETNHTLDLEDDWRLLRNAQWKLAFFPFSQHTKLKCNLQLQAWYLLSQKYCWLLPTQRQDPVAWRPRENVPQTPRMSLLSNPSECDSRAHSEYLACNH